MDFLPWSLVQKDLAASIKKNLKMSAATGLFILAAYFLVVLAMKYAYLGYVTVGRESGIGFACLSQDKGVRG